MFKQTKTSIQQLLKIRNLNIKTDIQPTPQQLKEINDFLQFYNILKNQGLEDDFICQYILENHQINIDKIILTVLFPITIESNEEINIHDIYQKLQSYKPLFKNSQHNWKKDESIDDFIEKTIKTSKKYPLIKSDIATKWLFLYMLYEDSVFYVVITFALVCVPILLSLIFIPSNILEFYVILYGDNLLLWALFFFLTIFFLSPFVASFHKRFTSWRTHFYLKIKHNTLRYDRNLYSIYMVYLTYLLKGFTGQELDNMIKYHYPEYHIDSFYYKYNHYHQVINNAHFPFIINDENPSKNQPYSYKTYKLIKVINRIYKENKPLLNDWVGYFYYGDVEKELQSIKDKLSNIVAKNYL